MQVKIQLKDKKGNPVNHQDVELNFRVSGAEIIVLDHGALTAEQSIRSSSPCPTNKSKCLAFKKTTENTTGITRTVRGEGLDKGELKIPVKAH